KTSHKPPSASWMPAGVPPSPLPLAAAQSGRRPLRGRWLCRWAVGDLYLPEPARVAALPGAGGSLDDSERALVALRRAEVRGRVDDGRLATEEHGPDAVGLEGVQQDLVPLGDDVGRG